MSTQPSPDETQERALAVRALESEFGELFMRMRRLYAEMSQRVHPELMPGTYKVLTMIHRNGGLTVSALAEHMMTDKAQVSRAVRELDDLGLIQRVQDPLDRRSSLLSLTPEAEERIAAARMPHSNPLVDLLAQWHVTDINRLATLLHSLTHSVTPPDPSDTKHSVS